MKNSSLLPLCSLLLTIQRKLLRNAVEIKAWKWKACSILPKKQNQWYPIGDDDIRGPPPSLQDIARILVPTQELNVWTLDSSINCKHKKKHLLQSSLVFIFRAKRNRQVEVDTNYTRLQTIQSGNIKKARVGSFPENYGPKGELPLNLPINAKHTRTSR